MVNLLSIQIVPRGRLGNLMFQYLLAWEVNRRMGLIASVHGPGMPEWGIAPSRSSQVSTRPYVLKGHLFDLDEAIYALRSGLADAIFIMGWGMRLEYFPDWKVLLSAFQSDVSTPLVGDDEILINIRAEDIEQGQYPGYFPLPFDFYEAVIQQTAKRPVFMGQIHQGRYAHVLRQTFRQARFLKEGSVIEDFQTIRNARHIVLSISSFAWLAAWSSNSAETIHYPVAGILDPRRGRQNLMPFGDNRYVHWGVPYPVMLERQLIDSAATWALQARGSRLLTASEIQAVAIAGFTVRVPSTALKKAELPPQDSL